MNVYTRWACALILATGISAFLGVAFAPTLIAATLCALAGLCREYDKAAG